LPQKKRPHQLPTHPYTSIGRFSWQFQYGCGPLCYYAIEIKSKRYL